MGDSEEREDLDEEQEGSEEEEETEEETAPAAPTIAAPPPEVAAAPRRGRGRPRKAKVDIGSGDPTHGHGMGRPPNEPWPPGAPEVWNRLVREEAPRAHMSAADLYVTVERVGLGPYQAPPVRLAPIEGVAIAGDDYTSPGEALMNYMMDVVHVRSPGPAKYNLKFMWRRSGAAKAGTLDLGSPAELAEMRAAAQHRAHQAFTPEYRGHAGMGARPGPQGYPGYPPYPPPPYYAPQAPPAPQPQGASPELTAIGRDIIAATAVLNERMRAEAEARGAPPPPPVVVPTAAAPAATPELEEARIARVVIGVLKGMGVTPPAQQTTAQQPAPVGFGSVVDRAKEQVAGLRQIVGIFKEVDKLREEVGLGSADDRDEPPPAEVKAVVEDPNKPAFGVRRIPFTDMNWPERDGDEPFLEWLAKLAASNPDRATKFLEGTLRVLDQGAFGTLLRNFAAHGGAAAQVATAVQDRTANGLSGTPAAQPEGYPPAPPPKSYPAP